MTALRLFYVCVLRSRCPCCSDGPLFAGWLRTRSECPVCGLVYDQWVGEWITPTYLASSVGMLVALALIALWMAGHLPLGVPLPPAVVFSAAGGVCALLALRPSKSGWLAFLYWVGGVEVSASTRARLRWSEGAARPPERLLHDAEARARHEHSLRATGRRAPRGH